MRYPRIQARNRPSPSNEDDYIEAYIRAVPNAERKDNYDIAAVISIYGTYGHALMDQSDNRSHDNNYHTCYDFVSDDELRNYYM